MQNAKKGGQGQLKPQQSHLLAIHHDDLRSGLRVTDGEGRVLAEVKGGRYRIAVELPPGSARVGYFRPNANKTGVTAGLPRIDAADPALAANEPARRAKLD